MLGGKLGRFDLNLKTLNFSNFLKRLSGHC